MLLTLLSATLSFAATAQEMRNDLNLVIAIDCSWSVNQTEYRLQIGGIATAFSDPEVITAIKQGHRGQIGVSLLQWSTHKSQHIALPWTRIASPTDAIKFASNITRTQRRTAEGGTSIAGALKRGQVLLNNAPFRADRHVVDVVADGENNNGERVEHVRDFLVSQGTTVNGLAIHNEVHYLHHYLRNRVIGGTGAFVEITADYTDFARAFKRKLLREIKGERYVWSPHATTSFYGDL